MFSIKNQKASEKASQLCWPRLPMKESFGFSPDCPTEQRANALKKELEQMRSQSPDPDSSIAFSAADEPTSGQMLRLTSQHKRKRSLYETIQVDNHVDELKAKVACLETELKTETRWKQVFDLSVRQNVKRIRHLEETILAERQQKSTIQKQLNNYEDPWEQETVIAVKQTLELTDKQQDQANIDDLQNMFARSNEHLTQTVASQEDVIRSLSETVARKDQEYDILRASYERRKAQLRQWKEEKAEIEERIAQLTKNYDAIREGDKSIAQHKHAIQQIAESKITQQNWADRMFVDMQDRAAALATKRPSSSSMSKAL